MPYSQTVPNRLLTLAEWVSRDTWPSVPCHECGRGLVHLKGNLHTVTDEPSQIALERANAGLGPREELSGHASGTLVCTNPSCKNQHLVSGEWKELVDFDEAAWRDVYVDHILVKLIAPTLPIIAIPPATPAKVTAAIHAASDVIWLNPSAAANQLRQAIEEILNHKKVRRTPVKKGGKPYLTTHQRISLYRGTNKDVADTLEAVKWIGNSGSHESTLTIAGVLEGADILADALHKLYDPTPKKLQARVKLINKRRGLPRAPKP